MLMQDLIADIWEKCNLGSGFAVWHLSFMFGIITDKALAKKHHNKAGSLGLIPGRDVP